jgi:hypothetical protein
MTDRLKGFVVTLEDDIREDDAQPLIEAIKHLRGVLDVESVPIRGIDDLIVERRVQHDFGQKLFKVIYPDHPERV